MNLVRIVAGLALNMRRRNTSEFVNTLHLWVLSPKPADYTVVDYKDEREDDLYM